MFLYRLKNCVDWQTIHAYFIEKQVNQVKQAVLIDSEFITLGKLLKHIDVISSGGMAKWYLAEHTVLLDNEIENRRGKKIYPGSVVEIPEVGSFFVQSEKVMTEEEL